MPLTPDDIAKRSFTPSADGYHQGEVREFLARIATEHGTVVASMPESQRQVSELTLAIANHEQRLHLLERRLQTTLDQLEATAEALQKTQDRASQQLAASRKVTADQRALIERLSTPPAAAHLSDGVRAEPRTDADIEARVAATTAAAVAAKPSPRLQVPDPEPGPSIAPPARAAAHLSTPAPAAPAADTPTSDAPAAPATPAPADAPSRPRGALLPESVTAERSTSPAPADASPPPTVPPGYSPPERPAGSKPTPSPMPTAAPERPVIPAPPAVPEPELAEPTVNVTSIALPDGTAPTDSPIAAPAAAEVPTTQLLDDLDKQPLISDNANDLLDNVLDDIMGDLTERPDA